MNTELDNDIETAYNAQMTLLYRKWGGRLTSDKIKLRYLSIITQHITKSIYEELKLKDIKVMKLKQIKNILKQKEGIIEDIKN